jgi:DNA polymerase elongation subunit (family B)
MFRNVYYNSKKSKICLWTSNGYKEIEWVPYVFINNPNGEYKNLDGESVSKKIFQNYQEYTTFQKNNTSTAMYENAVRPEIQFLAERYYDIPDEEIQSPKLLIYYLDIEVAFQDEFPNALEAKYPITLISVRDSITQKTITFGEKEYTGDYDIDYIHCPDEKELLRKFFGWMNQNPPDVISGWNVNDFDMTYLINRDEKINASKYYKLLSPIGIVKTWKSKNKQTNRIEFNIDIAGITIIDYMNAYKRFTTHNLESYKLDFVAMFELEKGKLDYSNSGDDLRELYKNDWNKYVDYNVIDCKRVNELGIKLGYIRLIQSFSLLTKSPMKYYDKVTQLVEGLMITHARRNGLCVPYLVGGIDKWFEGAYVKEPQKGKSSWLFSIDITSSYPSHIITLNMSVETYFGRILGIPEDRIIKHMNKKEFPKFHLGKGDGNLSEIDGDKLKKFNLALKKGMFSIAPCGTVFINKKPGLISTVERNIFFKRKEIKKLMSKESGSEREKLFAFQWALKILLNSVYGAMSVPYSRWFNQDIAEAITSCGRHTIKSGERFTNDIMNTPNEELLSLIDTIKSKYK